jgi:hypothetical protein
MTRFYGPEIYCAGHMISMRDEGLCHRRRIRKAAFGFHHCAARWSRVTPSSRTYLEHHCRARWVAPVISILSYVAAALAEIGGCFAFWAWLRLGASVWWLPPGIASLALFAYLLTLVGGRGRWTRVRRLWRCLHCGVSPVAVGRRGRAARSMGRDRGCRLPRGCSCHSLGAAVSRSPLRF